VALSRSRKVVAVVLLVAFGVGSIAVLTTESDALGPTGMLTVVHGAVLINHEGDGVVSARDGDVLAAGDTIRTGAGGSAEITYFDGSSLRLEPDAEIVVTSLRTIDGGPAQALGRAWHVVTQLISGSSRYEVRGPSSTASVRG
jgi:hypothetical protein